MFGAAALSMSDRSDQSDPTDLKLSADDCRLTTVGCRRVRQYFMVLEVILHHHNTLKLHVLRRGGPPADLPAIAMAEAGGDSAARHVALPARKNR